MSAIDYKQLFDYKDGKLFWKIKPSLITEIGDEAGTVNSSGYIQIKYKYKKILAHRIIFHMHYGFLPKELDHINRIKTDNRIENLRASTRSENNRNKGLQKNNKTGLKYISWHKATKKWILQINGKYHGVYETIEEAKKTLDNIQNLVSL